MPRPAGFEPYRGELRPINAFAFVPPRVAGPRCLSTGRYHDKRQKCERHGVVKRSVSLGSGSIRR